MSDTTAVVTCFNHGAFIAEAVASLLVQEGGAPRVVVVDDGSTDRATAAALSRLPPEVEVRRQPNRGPSAARNAGLRDAATPFLLALDGDDKLAPGALAAMRAALTSDPRLGFVYGRTQFFGTWSSEIPMPRYDPYGLLDRSLVTATALMRRELFDATGGFDESFSHYEDWELWLHALSCGWRGRQIEAVTLLYRKHETASNFTAGRAQYRAYRRRLRAKHAALYARRAQFARESRLSPGQRVVYRFWWGPRPLPARVEAALQRLVFRRLGARRRSTRVRRHV